MARHGDMAEQLRPLLKRVNRPDTSEPIVVDGTNWSVVPANDNNPEDVSGMRTERRWASRPTIDEIEDAIASNDTERAPSPDGKAPGPIVRIGRLHFSDGTQTEKAHCYGPEGKLIQYDAVLPVGAMLRTKDAQERMLGGGDDNEGSNSYYRATLGVKPRRYGAIIKRRKVEERRNYSREESIAMLAEAWRNTDSAPKTKYSDPALPWQPTKLSDLFVGMKKGKKGESGSISWEDISTSMVARETWTRTEEYLSGRDKAVLDAASTASGFADVGISVGQGAEYARRKGGKRALLAANDNLLKAITKAA